jgi:hypothetical protein
VIKSLDGCIPRCSSIWADSFKSRWPVEAHPVPMKKCRFCNEEAGSHTISSIAFIRPAVRLVTPAYCARAEDTYEERQYVSGFS